MSFNVGQAVGYLDLDTSGFNRGFKSALQDLKIFQDQSASTMDKVGAIGSAMTNVGSSMTKYVTTPIVSLGAAAATVGTKFESAMSRVQAISGATGSELEALTDQAMDLGSSTAFSASEVASGMENLASAGFTVEEIMGAMPGLLDLAASSGADLGTASEIAASAIRGFGLEADSAGHVADVFAEAAARTNAQTEDMGEAMKYVAPVANAMGQSLEETAAAIGIMSDAGIKGSQAGTALRGALSRLSKPTDAMTATMDRLGLSFFDAQGNMLPLNGIIKELEEGTAGLTQEQKNQAIVTLFGQNALSGMLALIDRGSDDLTALTESFENADGAAAEMAETMMDNTKGSIEEMMGALETLAINISQILAPVIRDAAEWLSNLINKFNSLSDGTQKIIIKLLGVAAATGPILLVVGKVMKGISSLSNAFKAAKTAFTGIQAAAAAAGTSIGAIAAPILAIVAAIAVLVSAFKHLWETNEDFRNKVTEIWDEVKGAFEKLASGIVDKLNSLGFDFKNITDAIKSVWDGFCKFLAPVFEGVFKQISNIFNLIVDQILTTLDFWIAVFKGDWEGVWEAVKNTFKNAWNLIVETFKNISNTLKGLFDAVLGWFGTSWEKTWTSIKDFFAKIWDSIIGFFKGLPDKLVSVGKNLVQGLWNGITSAGSWLMDKITGFANGIINRFKKAFGIASPAKSTRILGRFLPQGLALGVDDTADEAVDSIDAMSDSMLARAERMVKSVGNLFQDTNAIMGSGILQSDYLRSSAYVSGAHPGSSRSVHGTQNSTPSPMGGNVFNFYSPKAIDPVQAASLMRKTSQELALEV